MPQIEERQASSDTDEFSRRLWPLRRRIKMVDTEKDKEQSERRREPGGKVVELLRPGLVCMAGVELGDQRKCRDREPR